MNVFLTILRALFVLLMAGLGAKFLDAGWFTIAVAISAGVVAVCVDILAPARRKLSLFAGMFFGLVVGILGGYALGVVVSLLVDQLTFDGGYGGAQIEQFKNFGQMLAYCLSTYFSISFILQTKDDFRFIVPYVEFRKQARGSRPLVLDTSALIDGRIAAIAETGVFEQDIMVPRFILDELQTVADSADRLKRNRGRRGLDVLAKLQKSPKVEVIIYETGRADSNETVDQRLMRLAKELDARVLTTDFNLNKVAQLSGIDVININELAANMKPEVLPGERLAVRIVKAGESPGQGVGYLDDGTMVVVEQARNHLNEEVEFSVTNTVQTSAGKMIFGRLSDTPTQKRGRSEQTAGQG